MGCTASQQAVVPDDTPKPQQYQWYWQCWDEKVEYPADVRDRLEKAYTDFTAGRGPTYPMIQVGDDGDTVSLKAMQQISKTGIKRNVVRETTGPDRAAAWYYGSPKRCAGAEVPFDEGECDRLEEAYAAFQQGGAHTIKVDKDREVSLSKMRLRHMITGVRRAVVREALPEKYEWSCTKGERTPYAADVRNSLEGAYFELQQGRGASFPTVAVGSGNTVHLKTLQQISADWNFSPPPPDRVVRRTTPAYPYSPPVLKDLTSNPLGGSVRAATPARGRRSPSPTKPPDFRPRAVDAARKEGLSPHQEEETSTVLTPRRSPSPSPVALGPPARPAPASPAEPTPAELDRSRSRSPERPKTAAPFYGPRSRLPERPRSASPVGRNPYSPRDRNSVEAGWNPCFNHVVVENKPLDPQPYGPPPPEKPKPVRLDGVPQHLHPGSRRAAETAKKIKKYRRQRRRIAAEAEARVEALKERRAPWEASFAYPRGDSANRNAPRKQTRPATAQPTRPAADAAKQRPATAGAGRSPIRVDLARPPESHPIRIEPPARQPGTRDHLADKKNSYRAKLAKPPRFGPKVHACVSARARSPVPRGVA